MDPPVNIVLGTSADFQLHTRTIRQDEIENVVCNKCTKRTLAGRMIDALQQCRQEMNQPSAGGRGDGLPNRRRFECPPPPLLFFAICQMHTVCPPYRS